MSKLKVRVDREPPVSPLRSSHNLPTWARAMKRATRCIISILLAQAAVAKVPMPPGVTKVGVDDRSITDTFGCRIAVDLIGTFGEAAEGHAIARQYAQRLSSFLGVPAFAPYDLLRADSSTFLY